MASRFTVVSLHCMADDETHMVYLCLLESNSHTFLKYNCGVYASDLNKILEASQRRQCIFFSPPPVYLTVLHQATLVWAD